MRQRVPCAAKKAHGAQAVQLSSQRLFKGRCEADLPGQQPDSAAKAYSAAFG
jgi:hypothetical protein